MFSSFIFRSNSFFTSIVSLIIAFLALFYSVLKKGKAEIYPYLDTEHIQLSVGSRTTNRMPITFSLTIPFMVKNSGAKAVAVSDIRFRHCVNDISILEKNMNIVLIDSFIAQHIVLEPYEHKIGNIIINFQVKDYSAEGIEQLRSQFNKGLIYFFVDYSAYEGKKIRKVSDIFDLTERVKKIIF